MASEISVVICAYTEKRWHELLAAITSVQQQTCPPQEIIVVIDHNPDLLLRLKESGTGALAIENSGEKGLSGARNSGWSRAKGAIVAFLDDDAVAEPDWLENLAAGYANPRVAGVGGKILPLWEKRQPSWFPAEFNWVIGCTYRGMPEENARVRNVIGANMSMRREVLELVGGFREAFGCDKDTQTSRGARRWFQHYAGDEETELCIRVSQHMPGCVWLYAVSAAVQHRVSAERTRWSYFLWRCYDEGLGKASLVRLHDTSSGLSSERSYTFKTLPRGFARGLTDTFLRRDLSGLTRAGAIVTGLTMTIIGYLIGSVSSRVTARKRTDQTPARRLTTEASIPVESQS